MYTWLQGLYLFVAHHIWRYMTSVDDSRLSARLVLPYDLTDVKAQGSDDGTQFDFGLDTRPLGRGVGLLTNKPHYMYVLAVVEAKGVYAKGAGKLDEAQSKLEGRTLDEPRHELHKATEDAFAQLFMHTRQVYANQPNRRFAWGITQCHAEARACIFVNDGALASHAMDLRTEDGLREMVQLLVDWSLCELPLLGYDPTVSWLDDLDCWQIDVPTLPSDSSDASGAQSNPGCASNMTPYYFNETYVAADRLFGRHTRCYPATSRKPQRKLGTSPIKPDVVIKDAWAYVEDGDVERGEYGEVKFLERIRGKLKDPENFRHLPVIHDGGAMYMDIGGQHIKDTTETVLGDLAHVLSERSGSSKCHYSHMRMATWPAAYRLRNVESVYELIIIANDVVKAMGALKECNILHQDISNNNIMFTRDKDGNVCGILIDFDNAVDAEKAQMLCRPICTGTLPFMSVNNLEESDAARSGVEELESILYLLIWKGVWGATIEHRSETWDATCKVCAWNEHDTAAEAKQNKISTASNLRTILREFFRVEVPDPDGNNDKAVESAEWINGSYEFLEKLVLELRACLFDSPNLPPWARGTQPDSPEWLGFEERGSGWRAYGPGSNSMAKPFAEFEDPTICDGCIDPFRERTKELAVSVLLDAFAETLGHYAHLAQLHIDKSETQHARAKDIIQDRIDEARAKWAINGAKARNRAAADSDNVDL